MLTLKGIIFEDFINYKKPCMILEFPYCSFKCGKDICQNYSLVGVETIQISNDRVIKYYLDNSITEAIVMQGLEPFDSYLELFSFIEQFRQKSQDDIVIYTGYDENEITEQLNKLKQFNNIIIKFGRYIPNNEPHFDEILGVSLASDNQYAKRLEDIDI